MINADFLLFYHQQREAKVTRQQFQLLCDEVLTCWQLQKSSFVHDLVCFYYVKMSNSLFIQSKWLKKVSNKILTLG